MKLSSHLCERRPLIVLLGPTAVGKSRLAVQVAQVLDTPVLAADSRQVYRGMDIGTDKPPVAERQGVSHRLIDLVDPDQPFNAGCYRHAALAEIDRLYEEGRMPLVAGGTGLYIRALVRGLCPAPPANPKVRADLMRISRDHGRDRLYAELVQVDRDTAARLHPHDEAKVVRALEVYRLTGESISDMQARHAFRNSTFAPLLLGLRCSSEALYRRIEERIDRQLAHGLVAETQTLLDHGYDRHRGAMTGLGYRHVSAYLAGDYDAAEMIRRFKRDTRHFAKRQMTWFRKEPGIEWITIDEGDPLPRTRERVLERIEGFLKRMMDGPHTGLPRQMVRKDYADDTPSAE